MIDNSDVLKYSFSFTKLEDVKNQVNVKYKKIMAQVIILKKQDLKYKDTIVTMN